MCVRNLVQIGPQATTCIRLERIMLHPHAHKHTRAHSYRSAYDRRVTDTAVQKWLSTLATLRLDLLPSLHLCPTYLSGRCTMIFAFMRLGRLMHCPLPTQTVHSSRDLPSRCLTIPPVRSSSTSLPFYSHCQVAFY